MCPIALAVRDCKDDHQNELFGCIRSESSPLFARESNFSDEKILDIGCRTVLLVTLWESKDEGRCVELIKCWTKIVVADKGFIDWLERAIGSAHLLREECEEEMEVGWPSLVILGPGCFWTAVEGRIRLKMKREWNAPNKEAIAET